ASAKRCSRTKTRIKTAVNARKPGISRKLCSMPISAPLNCARSITKLLSNTCQVEKQKAITKVMVNNNNWGLRTTDKDLLIFIYYLNHRCRKNQSTTNQ